MKSSTYKHMFMIRRLKRDVLTDLPPKQRQEVWFKPAVRDMKTLEKLQVEFQALVKELGSLTDGTERKRRCMFDIKIKSNEMWRATAEAKSKAVCAWIKDTIDGTDRPIIIFCYHQIMMDAIEETLECDYMRIDGKTSSRNTCTKCQSISDGQTLQGCPLIHHGCRDSRNHAYPQFSGHLC